MKTCYKNASLQNEKKAKKKAQNAIKVETWPGEEKNAY